MPHPNDRYGVHNVYAVTSEGVTFHFEKSLLEDDHPLTRVYISRDGGPSSFIGTIAQDQGQQRFTATSHALIALSLDALTLIAMYISGTLEEEARKDPYPIIIKETTVTVESDPEDFDEMPDDGDIRFDPTY